MGMATAPCPSGRGFRVRDQSMPACPGSLLPSRPTTACRSCYAAFPTNLLLPFGLARRSYKTPPGGSGPCSLSPGFPKRRRRMPGAALRMDRMVLFVAFLVLMAAFSGGAWAQSPSPTSPPEKSPSAPSPSRKSTPSSPPSSESPTPQDDPCFLAILDDLIDCLEYVTPDANETSRPSRKCCSGVKKFLKDEPQCICYVLKAPKELTDTVDRGKAIKLVPNCGARIPPINQCFSSSSPTKSPDGSPAATSPSNTSASPPANTAPPPSNTANPSFLPSTTAFLGGIFLAIVAAFL